MPPRSRTTDHPGRNPQLEQLLTDRSFEWEFRPAVKLAEFDDTRSLQNQARIGKPVDEDTVNRYVGALQNGAVFPAIVAAVQKNRRLLRVDGNHRFIAHKTHGATEIPTYVITEGSPAGITLLTFELNTTHGLPTSEKERILQAMHLMDGGVTAEDAAKRLGIKVHSLRQAANIAAVDLRAEESGVDETKWAKLPASVKTRLGQITTDEGFAVMAQLTLDADLKTDQVSRAVQDMNTLRSSAKQVDYGQQLRKSFSHDVQAGGKRDGRMKSSQQRSARNAFAMTLRQISVLPEGSAIVSRMDEATKHTFLQQTEEALTRLVRIRDLLKK